jgi:hypothetical protein
MSPQLTDHNAQISTAVPRQDQGTDATERTAP